VSDSARKEQERIIAEASSILDPILYEINDAFASGAGRITTDASYSRYIIRFVEWKDDWTKEASGRVNTIGLALGDDGRIRATYSERSLDSTKETRLGSKQTEQQLDQWANIHDPGWREIVEQQILLITSEQLERTTYSDPGEHLRGDI